MQAEWTEDAIERITTGNVTLHERHRAVRSNLRIAGLDVRIAEPAPDVLIPPSPPLHGPSTVLLVGGPSHEASQTSCSNCPFCSPCCCPRSGGSARSACGTSSAATPGGIAFLVGALAVALFLAWAMNVVVEQQAVRRWSRRKTLVAAPAPRVEAGT
ncbi:hypothetical protein [Streptomyces platensis]|uniref:hypothetical protein n=1 Tax=Streptomyces platensis TaxID=58346 RepID=UPI0037907D97